jgi:hypothetical protein
MQSPGVKMQVPIQLKQITHLTTEVAFSTGFLASALVSGGCVAAGREEESIEGADVDAGEDAIVDVIHMGAAEARSHAYHEPPTDGGPVVMPLALEDAPTTPPPATALAPARKPAAKRRMVTVPRVTVTAPTTDDEVAPAPESVDVVSRASKKVSATDDRGERRDRAGRKAKKHDPIDASFVPTYGSSAITPMGGRLY